MGACFDKAVRFLRSQNLNLILQPSEVLAPLAMLGITEGECVLLGHLSVLASSIGAPSNVTPNLSSPDFTSLRSSRLPAPLGIALLDDIVAAIGGTARLGPIYANAERIVLTAIDTTRSSIGADAVESWLTRAAVNWQDPSLRRFLFGPGKLLLVTETLHARAIDVAAYDAAGAAVLPDAAALDVTLGTAATAGLGAEPGTIRLTIKRDLAYGFAALELSAIDDGDGDLRLTLRDPSEADTTGPLRAPTLLDGPLAMLADATGALRDGEAEPLDADTLRRRSAFYRVAPSLIEALRGRRADARERTIIELNVDYPEGLDAASAAAVAVLRTLGVDKDRLDAATRRYSRHNLFVPLTLTELTQLGARLRPGAPRDPPDAARRTLPSPIYKVWSDQPLRALDAGDGSTAPRHAAISSLSIRTIKAEACLTTFGADGKNIVVAIADSGIDSTHAHFISDYTFELPDGMGHGDFTRPDHNIGRVVPPDEYGHGTHIAGIIAGHYDAKDAGQVVRLREWHSAKAIAAVDNPDDAQTEHVAELNQNPVVLRGVAPRAKLLCLKVLNASGDGYASDLIAALDYLYQLNDSGRKLKVHCLNLSLGYAFDAGWYAAGQSPLCVVVNRLVRSGMVVVVAAGNDGASGATGSRVKTFVLDQSINDPGNAEEAITVGSTHAEAPHLYGVSYFSSRGPTADGRDKPDLLAPGERILSCAAAALKTKALSDANAEGLGNLVCYREDSGTSMAAAHVAGAVAAFLSIQTEYIGRPAEVKKVLMGSCTDLGRKREFQGAGLIDLMRAVQSV